MPLIPDAREIMKATFTLLAKGERPKIATIGYLTDTQFNEINELRHKEGFPPLGSKEIVLLGKHLFDSRCKRDGYSIDDICDQIESALSEESKVIPTKKMTALRNDNLRSDRYGNMVRDECVLELAQRKPKAELYSVIPKGDANKPPKP